MEQQSGGGSPARLLHPGRSSDSEAIEVDRISNLPDELLLQVLIGLGSAAEAGRTSVLARRWRLLWTKLDVLIFRGISDPESINDALAQTHCSRSRLSRLEIRFSIRGRGLDAMEVSSLLRAAEECQPEEFVFDAGGVSEEGLIPFELPCFTRATSMELQTWNRIFVLPPAAALAGNFPRLQRLTLSVCNVNPEDLLRLCPRLRVLHLGCYWMPEEVTLSSESLEEFVLKDVDVAGVDRRPPRRVHVVAPVLKIFKLLSTWNNYMIASFSAPMMEALSFRYCTISSRSVGFGTDWRLRFLNAAIGWSSGHRQTNRVRIYILSMEILASKVCVSTYSYLLHQFLFPILLEVCEATGQSTFILFNFS